MIFFWLEVLKQWSGIIEIFFFDNRNRFFGLWKKKKWKNMEEKKSIKRVRNNERNDKINKGKLMILSNDTTI